MSQHFSLPRLNTDIDDINSTNPFNDGFINNEETVFAKYQVYVLTSVPKKLNELPKNIRNSTFGKVKEIKRDIFNIKVQKFTLFFQNIPVA